MTALQAMLAEFRKRIARWLMDLHKARDIGADVPYCTACRPPVPWPCETYTHAAQERHK